MSGNEQHIVHHSSALPFVDHLYGRRISEQFSSVYGSLEVELGGNSQSQLCIRAFSVNDWCFSRITGLGYASIRNDHRALRFADHAFLVLTLSGQHRMINSRFEFPSVGQMALGLWEDTGATVSMGEFDYLCINIPLVQLIPYGSVSLDRSALDTRRGPGAVLKSSLFSLMKESLGSEGTRSCDALLPAFANLIMTALSAQHISSDNQIPRSRRLVKILDYLDRHCADPELTPDRVADVLGMSRRQLNRELQHVGETYTSQLRRLRLNRARELLCTYPDWSITQITYDCGFNSITDFGRNFRKIYGVSPKEFRSVRLGTEQKLKPAIAV